MTRLALACATVLSFACLSAPAQAFMGECMIQFHPDEHKELADSSQFTWKDSVQQRDLDLDFGDKTLATLEPGDTVWAHGQPHVLTQETHTLYDHTYRFTNPAAVAAHQERMEAAIAANPGRLQDGGEDPQN